MTEKTRNERQKVASEVKFGIVNKDLENEISSKILFRMLDLYVETGQRFIDKEITLLLPGDIPRKYIVNLHNRTDVLDTVVIKKK